MPRSTRCSPGGSADAGSTLLLIFCPRLRLPLRADPVAGRLQLQREPARHRLGRLLDQVVRRAAARPADPRRRLDQPAGGGGGGDARGGARHAGGLRADALRPVPPRALLTGMSTAPLVMPEVITGLSLLLLFVSMEQLIGWPAGRGMTTIIIAHITFCMAFVDGGGAVAARRHGREPRGGGDGPRRAAGAGVLRHHASR